MPHSKKQPIGQHAYDILAETYAASIDTKPHNAYYEMPATLSLLPDVQGKRVLDAGCGPGEYSEWLAAHGAEVIAFDGNKKMVRLARQRLGDSVPVRLANLEEPLDFLADESMDIVISPLVMDYIYDWEATFKEFHRILRSPGVLVFSIPHPFHDYDVLRQTSRYLDVELVSYPWGSFGIKVNMPYYRRPMNEIFNPLIRAGFILDKLLEPLPTEQFKQADPQEYELLMQRPEFMCIRALKGNQP